MPSDRRAPERARVRRLEEATAEFFEHNTTYSIMVVANLIARITTQSALAGCSLTLPEWRVLRLVHIFGPLSAAEITTTIGMDKTTVSRVITRLHRARLLGLSTDVTDRRRTFVALTPAGRRLHGRIAPVDERFDRTFELLLSSSELGVFRRVVRKLKAHAESLATRASVQRSAR